MSLASVIPHIGHRLAAAPPAGHQCAGCGLIYRARESAEACARGHVPPAAPEVDATTALVAEAEAQRAVPQRWRLTVVASAGWTSTVSTLNRDVAEEAIVTSQPIDNLPPTGGATQGGV